MFYALFGGCEREIKQGRMKFKNRMEKKGPTEIRTRVTRFKVWCDNRLHYGTIFIFEKLTS